MKMLTEQDRMQNRIDAAIEALSLARRAYNKLRAATDGTGLEIRTDVSGGCGLAQALGYDSAPKVSEYSLRSVITDLEGLL